MSKTTVNTDELKPAGRPTPTIDPARVTLQSSGFVWREYFVRCPSEMVSDDLKLPGIWSKLQTSGNSKALKKFDKLLVVAFDESWVAECVVASADSKGAVLAKPRITTMPERYDKLFQDDLYRVAWNGFGYIVERKADGHAMTQPTANAELATRLLAQLYPARVA
jgi:hypothetical protein